MNLLESNVANATRRLPQSQASLTHQLQALIIAAERLGLYDAADFLKNRIAPGEQV